MFYCLKFDFNTGILDVYTQNAKNHKLRKLTLTHKHKDEPNLPSPTWLEQVQGEIDYQLSEELAQERGARLPGY